MLWTGAHTETFVKSPSTMLRFRLLSMLGFKKLRRPIYAETYKKGNVSIGRRAPTFRYIIKLTRTNEPPALYD